MPRGAANYVGEDYSLYLPREIVVYIELSTLGGAMADDFDEWPKGQQFHALGKR